MTVRPAEREVSRGHSSCVSSEGLNDGKRAMLAFLGDGKPQKSGSDPERTTSQSGEAAMTAGRVDTPPTGNEHRRSGTHLNPSNRPVRTRMPGGVAGDAEKSSPRPYADLYYRVSVCASSMSGTKHFFRRWTAK